MSLHYTNNVFKELIQKYQSWTDLETFLESPEGGEFCINKSENGLCIIRYEKNVTNMKLPHSRWFRSVVWNMTTNRPVCVAPPKANLDEIPYTTFKECEEAGIICQELLDGFMINCFRISGDSNVYVATRSKLGGTGKFYSKMTFNELFRDALLNTVSVDLGALLQPVGNESACFCCFLVQHKENRIVTKINDNRVFLIHSGAIFEDGSAEITDGHKEFGGMDNIPNLIGAIPSIRPCDDVKTWIKHVMSEKTWEFQGLVFKDASGNRWRYRSEKYSAIKSLRGNSPIERDRFAQLYTQNLLEKYCEYYPEEHFVMTLHTMFLNAIIEMLYEFYVNIHVIRTRSSSDVDKMYLPHLYNIHGIFLSQLRPAGKIVTVEDIQIYMHSLPWQRISFLLKKMIG